jgi:glycosyltransferase involved in cell wall biosynthesis
MISIITPTWNRKDLLQVTIRSILNQTYRNWELVIVDDGSTDGTENAIQHFLADKRIRYVKKENSGQAHSLNVGATYVTGTYITFLDSDDEAYPNWLEVVNSHLMHDTGIACTGAMRRFSDGTIVKEGLWPFRFYGQQMQLKFTCGSLFIRRDLFNAIGGYDSSLRSNIQTDLGYRLLEHLRNTSLRIVPIDEYLVQINVHEGERIRTNWQKRRDGGVQFIRKHYDFIRRNDPKEVSNIYASIAFSSYKLKRRVESLQFLIKAIQHNPVRLRNYFRIIKYAF